MAMIHNDIQGQPLWNDNGVVCREESTRNKVDFFEKYAFIVTIIACVICDAGHSISGLVIVAAFAVLILKPEYLLAPILFFSIFDDYLLMGTGSSISRFLTLYFIAGAAFLILKRGTIKKESLLLAALIPLGVILSLYSIFGKTKIPTSYILNVVLAITIMNISPSNNKKIVTQIHTFAILAVVYVYYMLAKNGFDSLVDGSRMTIAHEVNSNQLAMGLAIAMALLASDLLIFGKHKVLNIVLMLVNCIALFLTGSRTGLIAGIAAIFLLFIVATNEKGKRYKAILFSVLGATIFIFVYSYLQENFPLLMERFTVENVEETGGTGRLDVWKAYFEHYFSKYWLIGIGFSSENMYYAALSINGEGHGAHNLVVEIISKTGLVGVVLYGVCFLKYFKTAFKCVRENRFILCSIAIVFSILVNGIGENTLTVRFLWFGIGLGYLLSNSIENKQTCLGGENGCRKAE